MNVEYTGRQAVVTDALRNLTEPYLDRFEKMLGNGGSAHIIVTAEKYRQIAEVTVKTRANDIVGLCESTVSLETALRSALDKAEAQAIRFKEKRATQKRLPKDEKIMVEPALQRPGIKKRTGLMAAETSTLDEPLGIPPMAPPPVVVAAKNGNGKPKANGNLREFPVESHVTRAIEAVALAPMSLEEAVKEMEYRNKEIFVFRDRASQLRILHCKRDGTLELIELP